MIDSHVHIDAKPYLEFEGGVEQVLADALAVGVDRVVAPSTDLDSYRALLALKAHHPEIYPAAGIHPHYATEDHLEGLAEALERSLASSQHPIVGETGLEGHYDLVPMEIQVASLKVHLDLAKAHGLPVILHCRNTEELLYNTLKKMGLKCGVIHCFTGNWEWAERFLELGFHIGITGIVTFKNSHDVQAVAKQIPSDRLLVETDGPYLAPVPFRGKVNKPEYIPHIVEKIAQLRDVLVSEIAATTTDNTERLFRLPKLSPKIAV